MMDAEEKAMLIDTIESLAAMSLILGATFAVLNKDVSNLKGRMLAALGNAKASPLAGSDDNRRALARATTFVTSL
ncbi:hypothetical protein [Candidatus Binatus sp.]|jgi:hypothetical protein|uniref:hypothetical protein n=1 Tax=Candidatus Binatus sp. TaxID=2811406 RepID=UPI003F95328A